VLKVRCELLGIALTCPECDGHGDIATPELREEREAWEMPDPPEGPGYQLWQTVSEGGPVSPVFESLELLADWLASHHSVATQTYAPEEWMRVLRGEAVGMDVKDGTLV
jgi:hypothetical protein